MLNLEHSEQLETGLDSRKRGCMCTGKRRVSDLSTLPGQRKEECKGKEAFKVRSAMPGLAEEASRSALF